MNDREQKLTRALRVCICAAFAAVLAVLAAAGVLRNKETYSYFENRSLARKPELTAEGIASGEYFQALDKYLTDQAPGRNTLLKADTFIDLHILHLPVVNDVVVRDNILLPYLPYNMFNMDSIPWAVGRMTENLTSVRDAAHAVGAEYYYVAVPCQYAYFEDDYPWYLNNNAEYTAASRAALRDALERAGVNYIDIGDLFASLGSPRDLGSTVDNHYPLYGAFLACRAILERAAADTGLDIPILTDSDVTFTQLPNTYIGSRTRKLMGLWDDGEKLSFMTPSADVPFLRLDAGRERPGEVYDMPANPWEWLTYSFYMGGDVSETAIDTGRDGFPSVLIYGDSFTNAVECVMYLSFNETRSLDLRYYKDKTLGEYIAEYKPDLVICIRDYEALLTYQLNGQGANG